MLINQGVWAGFRDWIPEGRSITGITKSIDFAGYFESMNVLLKIYQCSM